MFASSVFELGCAFNIVLVTSLIRRVIVCFFYVRVWGRKCSVYKMGCCLSKGAVSIHAIYSALFIAQAIIVAINSSCRRVRG
jgi:hypothetical protein